MKKILLLAAGVAFSASSIGAQSFLSEPGAYEELVITKISPNGKWAVSDNPYGVFSIIDLENGVKYDYEVPEDDYTTYYSAGTGNCVSNNGIVLLSTSYEGTPSYFEDGEIKQLDVLDGFTTAFSQGITPDGSRICGTLGFPMSVEDIVMQTPVIWNRLPDGTYSDPIQLPYPDKDWTGRTPQYILVQCISDDGKTIAGQVHDYEGTMDQPIVFHEDENGDWTYTLVHPELINVNNIEFPEYPGEAPESPDPINYMSEDEYQEWQIAMSNWNWMSGDEPPAPEDYMTPEEREEYEAANDAYLEEFNAWNEAFNQYWDLLQEAKVGATMFEMNNVFLSGNGRYYVSTHYNMDNGESYPVFFDLATGYYQKYKVDDVALRASYVNDDAYILAATEVAGYARNGYIAPGYSAPMMLLSDYVESKNVTAYDWMESNMIHDIDYMNWITGETITMEDAWVTGTPLANADLSILVTWTSNEWSTMPLFYSYIIPCEDLHSGVESVASTKALKVAMDKAGVVTINGEASALEIFDVNGRLVFSAKNPAASVATGLKAGVYVVNATAADGKTAIYKAVI